MASHFSTIGYHIESEDDFGNMVNHAANNGESIYLEDGSRYIQFELGNGAELWVQISAENSLLGINPHFSGDSVMRVGMTERIKRTADSPLDGAWFGWANPITDPTVGDYPFVFDSPDYGLLDEIEDQTVYDVQLTGFAHELRAYWSEKAFYEAQEEEPKVEAKSFIASGIFDMDGKQLPVPKATAFVSGVVLEAKKLTNPITDKPFHWAKIATLGGEMDIVADPEIVQGMIKAGGVIRCACWVSGRVWSEEN